MEDFYFLQLVNYFAARGFIQVSLVSSQNGKRVQDDSAWMLSAATENYAIVRISKDSYQERIDKQIYLQFGLEKMKEIFNSNNDKVRMLDISLNEDGGDYVSENIDFITLTPNTKLSDKVLKQYPDILDIFKVEKEETFNLNRLKEKIDKQTAANRRAFLKSVTKLKTAKTFVIVGGVCVIIFALATAIQYFCQTSAVNAAIICGGYYKAFVSVLNQYYRFLTSGFVHVSFYHLLTNLYSLSSLSKASEKEFGFKKTIIILLISIIMGSMFVFIGEDNIVTVGLSGGLYGLLGAMIVVYFNKGYFKNPKMLRPFITMIVINLLISLLPDISLLSHLGGLIAGLFLGAIFSKDTAKNLRINAIICGCIIVISTIGACVYFRGFNTSYFGTDSQVYEILEQLHLVKDSTKDLLKLFSYYGG